MSGPARKWDDLNRRIATGAAMALVGIGAVWAGGAWFIGLVALVSGLMIWELARMICPTQKTAILVLPVLAGGTIVGFASGAVLAWWLWLGVVPVLGALWLGQRRVTWAVYSVVILGGGAGLAMIRQDFGLAWMFWLVLVVIVTDIAGYFVGRMVGGPKFWPRISPRKTWSGTVGGWVGAAIVGLGFADATGVGMMLVPASVALALASQLGDIGESAIKRSVAVKDSSNLLPGHGGVLDRFDGMIAAAFVLTLILPLFQSLFGHS